MQEYAYLQMQLRLQRAMKEANPTQGGDPFTMTPDELAVFITWNHTALCVELGEAMAEVGWKPWASSRHINYEAFVREMVDGWHFFMNMMLGAAAMAQVPVNDLAQFFQEYYVQKNAKNLQRQVEGYDGVTGKCPICHRDLSEVPALERWQVSGTTYCSLEHARVDYPEQGGHDMSQHDPARVQEIRDDVDARSGANPGSGTPEELAAAAKEAHRREQQLRALDDESLAMAVGKGDPSAKEEYIRRQKVAEEAKQGATSPAVFKDPAQVLVEREAEDQDIRDLGGVDDPEDGRTERDNYINPHAVKMVREAEITGEPLFCFRARDFFSIQVIAFYAQIVEQYGPDDAGFHNNIIDALGEFKDWQKDHITEVRYPD